MSRAPAGLALLALAAGCTPPVMVRVEVDEPIAGEGIVTGLSNL